MLTRHLREHGAQNGCILAVEVGQTVSPEQIAKAIELAKAAPNMAGLDLAQTVTCEKSHVWTETEWRLFDENNQPSYGQAAASQYHVVALDFGVKSNILRMLAQRGCKVTVVPAKTPVAEVLALKPDGVFLSNGPGDPEPCDYAISAAQTVISKNIPTFGEGAFTAIMGAEGIRELLRTINIDREVESIRSELKATGSDAKIKNYAKRLKVL